MTPHIALLRAVNVGGSGKLAMADLRGLAASLGFEDARTWIQSGNLVFRAGTEARSELERLLEAEAERRLGLKTAFFVRAEAEWRSLIEANPFPDEARAAPSRLVLMALKDVPERRALAALEAKIAGPEEVRAEGRHLYIVYPDGIGRSRLTGRAIEESLGTLGTGRNWNTVLKLAALAEKRGGG